MNNKYVIRRELEDNVGILLKKKKDYEQMISELNE